MIAVGRRLAVKVTAAIVLGLALAAPAHAETAAAFMQRAATELLAANRTQSAAGFGNALRKYGDVPGIGLTALGDYAGALPKADRPLYYSGLVNFISRYAAKESGQYAVANAVVLGQTDETATGVAVETRVELRDGQSYDVRWQLVRYGGSYKIRDAQVLGFWMTPFLGDLFQKYIVENGGSSKALILALTRYGGGTGAEATAR